MTKVPTLKFTEAFKLFFIKNYANFNGRSRRSEYWWPQLAILVLEIALATVCATTFAGTLVFGWLADDTSSNEAAIMGGSIIAFVMAAIALGIIKLVTIVPQIAGQVRRLHDISLSGWLAAFPYGIYLLFQILSAFAHTVNAGSNSLGYIAIIGGSLYLISEGAMCWMYCKDSATGRNQWGDSPKYPDNTPPSIPGYVLHKRG